MNEVTRILSTIEQGDANAAADLLPLVYEELRRLARRKMSLEAPRQTLQATALVHEAYLRLVGSEQQQWKSRAHFFAAAAEAMRRILIDNARRKRAQRRGGGQTPLDIQDFDVAAPRDSEELLAVHGALDELAAHDPTKAELVKLKYFAGMSLREAGEILGISEPTAKRYWSFARAWLFRSIHKG